MANKKSLKLEESAEETPKDKPTIEELLAETDKIRAEDATKQEEAVKLAEEEAKEETVEVDLDEEREKTKKEALETVEKEIVEPLRKEIIDLKETLSPTEKDDYEKFVDSYTEKNGKAPEWKEVAMFLEDRAVARVEEKQKLDEEAQKKAEEDVKATQEKTAEENFKVWQNQLQEMEEKGMIPKMEKPEAGDKGFDARVQLYGELQSSWKTDRPMTNLWEVLAKQPNTRPAGTQPAGEDSPVSLGNSGGSEDDTKSWTYDEIHKGSKDLESFIYRELQKAGKTS